MVLLWYRGKGKNLCIRVLLLSYEKLFLQKGQAVSFRLSSLFSTLWHWGKSVSNFPFCPSSFFNRGLRFLFLQRGGGGKTELDEKEEEKEI